MGTSVATQAERRLQAYALPAVYVLLLTWLLIGPLWGQAGLPNSADGILHLHRSAAVARAWSAGVWWPRWFPDVYQGLGAPVFHYYSPLFYLLVAPLHLLGLPLALSAKLVLSAFFVGSGLAVWAWLRRLLTPVAGYAGAALYLSQAHLFREFYFQGDYPQLLALLLLPVVLWSFTHLYLRDHWSHWLVAPLSLVLLVTAHNITALLGAGVLLLYWLALHLWERDWRGWWRVLVGVALALGLSAFFWLPAMLDTGLVQVENLRRQFFAYSQYFVPWHDLLAAPPAFDSRAANPPFPHLLGWAAWLAVLAGLLAVVSGVVRRPGWTAARSWALVGLGLVALSLALTQPWSTFLWENLPFLALVQYPGRWLGMAALGVALAGGAALAACRERLAWALLLALLLVIALVSGVFLFPHQPFRAVSAYTGANTQAFERYDWVWGTTSGNEFLPRWADIMQAIGGRRVRAQVIPEGAEWSWETPHRGVLQAAAGQSLPVGPLILPLHYFPAWQATVDGSPLPVAPTDSGLMRVDLAATASQVVVQWQGTAVEKLARWISLLALLAWVAAVGLAARRGRQAVRQRPDETPSPLYWSLAVLALLLALILARGAIDAMDLGWFQRSSPPGEVRHVQHAMEVNLGGDGYPVVSLLGWELLSGSPKPGSQVRIRLYWQPQAKISEPLHSFGQLYVPSLQQSRAGVQNHNPGRIPTASWKPELYYVDDLTIDLPGDLAPATYVVAIGMVNGAGERLDVPGQPDDLVFLDEIEVQPLRAGRQQLLQPDVAAAAQFGQSLRLQGYDLLPDPGGPVLRLYWHVLKTPVTDLVTFVHLEDDQGRLVTQYDGPPLEGFLPTDEWPPRSLLIDRRKLWLPEDLPSGLYRFKVGLYERDTEQRLKVVPDAGAEAHYEGDALVVPLDVP